ncbi:hypothetical protein GCM10007100_36190 [Roseibacillus persicicus]|uniref:Cadherin domain-containing protein n=1 Tax=Roseibacillus persicicus TaxID=454148 RepID=A0A918U0T3_9BACT|nr:hypothetical protein GCM10007100_36190 [Roseibacillus persicicus]
MNYAIYRSLDVFTDDPELIGHSDSGSFIDTEAQADTLYYYRIQPARSDLGRYGGLTEPQLGFSTTPHDAGNQQLILHLNTTDTPVVDRSGFAPVVSVTQNGATSLNVVEVAQYEELNISTDEFTIHLELALNELGEALPVLEQSGMKLTLQGSGSGTSLLGYFGESQTSEFEIGLAGQQTQSIFLIAESGQVQVFLNDSAVASASFAQNLLLPSTEPLQLYFGASLQTKPKTLEIYRRPLHENERQIIASNSSAVLFLSPSTISENAEPTIVGALTLSSSPNATFQLLGDPSYSFEIVGNQVRTTQPIDYEHFPLVTLTVQATPNSASPVVLQTIVQVLDQQDSSPTALEERLVFGTNPNELDSDNDGYSDLNEIFYLGSDPTQPNNPFEVNLIRNDDGVFLEFESRLSGLTFFNIRGNASLSAPWFSIPVGHDLSALSYNGATFKEEAFSISNFSPYFESRNQPQVFRSENLQHLEEDGKLFAYVDVNWYDFSEIPQILNWDSDGDGLSNAAESFLNLSTTLSDTDGDGLTDLDEIIAGTNPHDPADGYIPFPQQELDPVANRELGFPIPNQSSSSQLTLVLPTGQIISVDQTLQPRQ